MRKYIVVTADSIEQLEIDVNELIVMGYRPQGGIYVVTTPVHLSKYNDEDYVSGNQYHQVMIYYTI